MECLRINTSLLYFAMICLSIFTSNSAGAASLLEAVQRGLIRSPEIATERSRVSEKEVEIDIERDAWYPGIQGSAELSSGDTETRYELRASQTLYDWGVTGHRVDRARAERNAQSYRSQATREEIALDITLFYLDWIRAKRRLVAVDNQIDRLSRLVNLTRKRVGAVVDRVELTRAELALARAQEQRVIIVGEVREAASLVHERAGVRPERHNGELDGLSPDRLLNASRREVEKWIDTAPRIQQAQSSLVSAESNAEVTETEYLPRISLDAIAERTEGRTRTRTDNRIALRVETPLFQGLSAFRRPKAARYGLAAAQQDVRTQEQMLQRDIVSARTLLGILEARKPALQTQLESADITIKLYFDQFMIGRRDIVDMIGAESERIEAVFSSIDIKIEQATLVARIAADLGRLEAWLIRSSGDS